MRYHADTRALFIGLALALSFGLKLDSTRADEPNYEGKTIRVIVGSSAGGGSDTTGRMIARVLPKYLPGNPKSIVQNMPGAGGVIANNYFASEVKGDGLTCCSVRDRRSIALCGAAAPSSSIRGIISTLVAWRVAGVC
jgi:tripartite-type tricarboxylate transporter receptor subunit TctC